MANQLKPLENNEKTLHASGLKENEDKRDKGKAAGSPIPAGHSPQEKEEKSNKGFDSPHLQKGDQTNSSEQTGVQKTKDDKPHEILVTCPPGQDRQQFLDNVAASYGARQGLDKVKPKCVEKTEGSGSGSVSQAPARSAPGAGAGTSPTTASNTGAMASSNAGNNLSNKVVNYQGQQYFNPQGGLPSPPSGYSWQGRDYATLVNNATNTAQSISQTLQLFNQAQAAQTSARAPGGTNPVTAPSSFPLTTNTSSNPVSPFTDTGKYIPSSSASRTGNAMGWAMDQLRREGVPEQNLKAAAAHLVGQATMESGLDPTKVHDQGTGYGIYGARLDRRTRMFNWLDRNGFSRNSLEGQIRYMAKEAMTDPAYSTTRNILVTANANNFASQVPIITKNFENPAVINYRTNAVLQSYNTGPGGTFAATGALPQTGIGVSGGGGSGTGAGSGTGGTGGAGGLGGTGLSGIGTAGSSATPIGGGSAAGGGGGSGAGIGSGASLGLQYQRPQEEGQGGYIAQAAAATIAARTGGLGSLAANSLMSNMAGGLGGGNLGGLASSILGGFGGPALSGSVSPNYNVPNWSGGQIDAASSGVNPMSAIGNYGIPANSASMFPMGNSFSQVSSGLGSTPNILTNSPTTAPLASTNNIGQNLGSAANQSNIPQTPQGQFGQFGQSISGAGGGGGGAAKSGGKEGKEQKNKTERPTQTTKRAERKSRSKQNDDKELDKKLDKQPPLPPTRPSDLADPLVQAQTGRKSAGEEGPENQSVQKAPGIDPNASISDFTGAIRNLTGSIPGLEAMLMRLPNQVLGQFIGNMPAGLQSLLPQGLVPGLSQGPVGLNNLLQLVGGGALGGAAGQMIRSMAGGIPVASMLTQSLQAVPITQVFGSLGQDIGTSAAAISNTLGSITNVASRGLTGGIPVNSAQLNQAISYALASSGSSLSVPINTLGVASQITNNPVGSLVNIAMGKLISNGSVPILPTNLSGTNAALLAGLNQQIPQEDAQLILTIGQITGLLPPNVRNLIPPVASNAFGGPRNAAENSRNNSVRQTDSDKIYGSGGSRREFEQVSKPSLQDQRNIPYGMKLSEHYSLYNLTIGVAVCHGCHRITGLHIPPEEEIQNLMLLARNILEPIRAEIGPPTINSGYRGDDPHTKQNKNWQRSLHGYGRAADLSWGSYAKISQAVAYASARLHATENLHEERWHHIAVAGGTGGKGGSSSTRTPEGNITQGNNAYKGYPGLVNT